MYFTVFSLQKNGFVSELDNLGFDEMFYGGILAVSGKFSYTNVFGNIVLYKSSDRTEITKKSVLLYLLSFYESVEMDLFIEDCLQEYGIRIQDKYDVLSSLDGTSFYYDSIMGKVYRDKEVYYAEFEDM